MCVCEGEFVYFQIIIKLLQYQHVTITIFLWIFFSRVKWLFYGNLEINFWIFFLFVSFFGYVYVNLLNLFLYQWCHLFLETLLTYNNSNSGKKSALHSIRIATIRLLGRVSLVVCCIASMDFLFWTINSNDQSLLL